MAARLVDLVEFDFAVGSSPFRNEMVTLSSRQAIRLRNTQQIGADRVKNHHRRL